MDAGCGGPGRDDNFDCIFAPLSSTCGIAHAGRNNSVYHPRLLDFNQTHELSPVRSC